MSTAPELRSQLVEHLTTVGALRSSGWRDAFNDTPRELFLPRFYAPDLQRGGFAAIDQADADWLAMVYRDDAWTTQLDGDGSRWEQTRREGLVQGIPTASSSAPSIMAHMLEALDIHDGDRILELGTGTGYDAALLCHRLGDANVTSIDIDNDLVTAARLRLTDLDYFPTLRTVDGDQDNESNRAYDKLLCTYAAPSVPPAWLRQLRPGGQLLTHLHRNLPVSLAVRLTVDEDGNASGNFLGDGGCFMASRNIPVVDAFAQLDATVDQQGQIRDDGGLTLSPDQPYIALAALRLTDLSSINFQPTDGEPQEWLLASDGSWACHYTKSGTVEQYGKRSLWNEIESIHAGWVRRGRPALSDYEMWVGPDGSWSVVMA